MRIARGMALLCICVLIGWSKAAEYTARERIMRALSKDTDMLAAEMEYRPREMTAIVQKLAKGELEELWVRFCVQLSVEQTAEEAWEKTVKAWEKFSMLRGDEQVLILETGNSLGSLGIRDSVRMLRHISQRASKNAEELRRQMNVKGQLYRKLGLFGGLAAMLLVI